MRSAPAIVLRGLLLRVKLVGRSFVVRSEGKTVHQVCVKSFSVCVVVRERERGRSEC